MNTPLTGLQEEIVLQRQNNTPVKELSKKYNVSRQAIYDLLKKAEKEGSVIPWKKAEKIVSVCTICNKQFFGKTKTCSRKCKIKLMGTINIKKDSKWSRHSFVNLDCTICGKKFKRSNYLQSISTAKKKSQNIKQNYCSKECYYNRTGVNN